MTDTSEAFLSHIVERLAAVPGVAAIALGGSRARGWHSLDSDYDVGLYYRASAPIDLARLDEVAAALDDDRRRGLMSPFGGWGAWVDGGAWLKIEGGAVDLLYRNLDRVDVAIEAAQRGEFETAYHVGHPHAFLSTIYAGEVAICRPLRDPAALLAARKAKLVPYPAALKRGLVRRFLDEAGFTLLIAKKGAARGDAVYVSGCAFRIAACLCQAIFALNGEWLINEKGAAARAGAFALAPAGFAARLNAIASSLGPSPDSLQLSLKALEELLAETGRLAAAQLGPSILSGTWVS
jgi:predicted nucleotidyltransferase